MDLIWAAIVALGVAVGAIIVSSIARRVSAVGRRPVAPTWRATTPVITSLGPPEQPAFAARELPPEVQSWRMASADALPAAQQHMVAEAFRNVPRPPRLLSHLVSRELVNSSDPQELAELIAGEPLIAARVLLAVNSPLYGLSRPVTHIGHAVTLLGTNQVRVICMRYVLMQTFRSDSAERTRLLQATWNASALAGELCHNVMQRSNLPEGGELAGEVVLSFLGRLAVTAAVRPEALALIPARGFVERARAEQDKLGLAGGEIGRLLMVQWGLPRPIADSVAEIDRIVVTPWDAAGGPGRVDTAFACLCARLGERLAFGELACPSDFDLDEDEGSDVAALRTYLADASFARRVEMLKADDLAARMQAVLQAMQPERTLSAA